MLRTHEIEARRLATQQALDVARARGQRNRRGQFATPRALADEIVRYARAVLGNGSVRFLDPAIGTGCFYSALLRAWPVSKIVRATGFEIDPYYANPCRALWQGTALRVCLEDFTASEAPLKESDRYNLVICNPPYVRHHHIPPNAKRRLQRRANLMAGARLSGLAGLYAYFLTLAHPWMCDGALAGWLIPAEFMDVNYGQEIKRYLLERVTLLRVHRFDPVELQFDDALVTSSVVWFRNTPPPTLHQIDLSTGGSFSHPKRRLRISSSELTASRKWSCVARTDTQARSASTAMLGDFFHIQRGIATGANRFFIMTSQQALARGIPEACLRPVIPPPRHLDQDEIPADERGYPLLAQRLVLLNCDLPEELIRERHPDFFRFLEAAKGRIASRYLCSRRSPWYSQEARAATFFLCTYFARPRPDGGLQRFIFNRSAAIATNSYLMLFPRDRLKHFINDDVRRARAVWQRLCEIAPHTLSAGGRVYGGGMHKLEPRELAAIPAAGIAMLLRIGIC